MATIFVLLYASPTPSLSTILCDLDIATITTIPCNDIEEMIHIDNNTIDAIDSYSNVINGHNVKDIVVILDKLQCINVVTALLNLDIIPEPDPNIARTATINHSLNYAELHDTYARTDLYNALYNYNRILCPNNHTRNAIQNGLRVTTMAILSKYAVTDDDIKCCTSLSRLVIEDNTEITTFTPFAKTLRVLSIPIRHNTCSIDDNTLSSCTNLKELNINRNDKITTCDPFAKSLKILYANMYINRNSDTVVNYKNRGMSDNGLSLCTNIEILYAENNINITTCAPFATSLKILHAGGYYCGITDDGLSSCTAIQRLYAESNIRISTCTPFADTLKILHTEKDHQRYDTVCNITDAGLSSCTKICDLNACDNKYITICAPFANFLTKLNASGDCGISDAGLSSCSSICELNASRNSEITTCIPFAKSLTILRAFGCCGISNAGLYGCIAIEKLYAADNSKITSCDPFARTLNALYASRHSGIDDKGISRCTSITHLDASNNSKITTCDPFASTLRVLEVSNVFGIHDCYSGIGDMGLKMCHNIKALHANYNPKITTCAPFANTLRILAASESSGISNNGLRLCNSLTRVTIYGNAKIDKTYIETRNKNILDIFQ